METTTESIVETVDLVDLVSREGVRGATEATPAWWDRLIEAAERVDDAALAGALREQYPELDSV